MMEFNFFRRLYYKLRCNYRGRLHSDETLDADVRNEMLKVRRAIRCKQLKFKILVTQKLSKFYGNFLALNQLYLDIKRGECFGIIGGNGAGKSTAIKLMVGDIHTSAGSSFVKGNSIKSDLNDVQELISYCPQSRGLHPDLTANETFKILRLIRGVSKNNFKKNFGKSLVDLGLSKLLKKRVSKLSEGNKRKISTTLALLGDSEIIFLDEPTTGVDPEGRRILWDQIRKAQDAGRTIILTSHSTEECEALCNRVGVLVEGELKCIGPIQYLRNKFANGYVIKIQIEREDPELVKEIICKVSIFAPSAVFKEQISTFLIFHIENAKLSEVFGNLARLKEALNIENFTINQMNLEDVYSKFSNLGIENLQ